MPFIKEIKMNSKITSLSILAFWSFLICIILITPCDIFSLPMIEATSDKIAKIEQLMSRIRENGQLSGTILVTVNGEVIYKSAIGYANIEWKIPNTLDTKFRIASATKPFTVMLILQLVEEGKLKLDGKLTDYLPEFPKEKGRDITIHQLLTHRSGIIGESKIPDLDDVERLYFTKDELLKYISEWELSYKPGTRSEYSNFGYALLGMIIEKVSGKSYAQLLQEKICEPAGMKNTIPDVNVPVINNRASGYNYNHLTGPQNSTYLDMSFVFSYGHLLSTVEDLYLWDKALYTEKLLSEKSKELFFNRYGWLYFRYPYGKNNKKVLCSNLDGSINGFASHIQRIEKDKIFIAFLRNMKEQNNQIVIKWESYIASRILAILYDEEYDMPRMSAAYSVFRVMLDSGIQAAIEKYHDLYTNHKDSYYFEDSKFDTLANKFDEIDEYEKAMAMRKLISKDLFSIPSSLPVT